MIRVKSSNIHSIGYDPVEKQLSVMFNCSSCREGRGCAACDYGGHNGQVYTYEGVPAEHYAAVRDAESVGRAFGEKVKAYKHPAGHPEEGQGFKFSKRPA